MKACYRESMASTVRTLCQRLVGGIQDLAHYSYTLLEAPLGHAPNCSHPRVFRNQFSKKSPRALHVPNHGWWQLAVGGWRRLGLGSWQLPLDGGSWWLTARLVVGDRSSLAVSGGWWRLVVGVYWRLAVDGSWRLAVGGPFKRSLRAVLSKKKKRKIGSLKDRPGRGSVPNRMYPL